MFDDDMEFSTYNDFFKRRKRIKEMYTNMDKQAKAIYKLYLYAQREMSVGKVDLIWEYLNEPSNSLYCPSDEQLMVYFVEALEPKPTNKEYLEEEKHFEY